MKSRICLENLGNYIVSFDDIQMKQWIFKDKNGNIPLEVQDQIFPLSGNAVIFLRKFEETQKILSHYPSKKYFKTVEVLKYSSLDEKEIKKWLYEKGISFDSKVIWREDTVAFIITWKMVIRFALDIFLGRNGLIWDQTLNWVLGFEHNDILIWGKDKIYNNEVRFKEIETINRLIENKKMYGKTI